MLKWLAIIAVIGPLAAVGVLAAQQMPRNPPEERIAESGSGQSGGEQPQAKSGSQATPKAVTAGGLPNAQICDETCQQGRENIKIQGQLALFTGLLVAVGILEFVVGGLQVLLLRFTWKTIEDQVVEMRRQVTASHDGLRAWIGITVRENQFTVDFNATLPDKMNQIFNPSPPRFEWEIKNHGQTPAFIKTVEISNFAYSTPSGKLKPGEFLEVNGFLGAGQADAHKLTLSHEGLNKCELGQMFWRISVKVIYEDVFNRPHDTMFSFHYNAAGGEIAKGFYQDRDKTTNYYH